MSWETASEPDFLLLSNAVRFEGFPSLIAIFACLVSAQYGGGNRLRFGRPKGALLSLLLRSPQRSLPNIIATIQSLLHNGNASNLGEDL
jgi:hypothetical protein